MPESIYKESLKYHQLDGRPGKLEVQPTKPTASQRDLSLAYSPGVAEPCRVIAEERGKVYDYTNKGNLVAVISNGTAVLGLGNIGPEASKPVMEGKAVLFKRFADIDVFDIELDAKDPDRFIETVAAMAPTFGGINLEDIKGPECFRIERELRERLEIPVFHDDQHGTAIISAAALLNACELTKRELKDVRCVFNGAGAAGVSCARLFIRLGVKPEHVIMCDSKGVIHTERDKLTPEKQEFARDTKLRTLAEAMKGSDCFIGCSVGNVVTPEMLLSMNRDPIVFAMANPTPEIDYPLAVQTRRDVIMATGRSDYPNQVNNVLGFPFIFRGALDVRATTFNEQMILAAVHSLAELAKQPVPSSVSQAYGGEQFEFGRRYLIPKPFDQRVLYWESVAVARAAIESGVARVQLDLDEYRERLRRKVDAGRSMVSVPLMHARKNPPRIAIPDCTSPKLATVARLTIREGIATPLLVGCREKIEAAMEAENIHPGQYEVVDPADEEHVDELIPIMRRQRPLDELSEESCREELRDDFAHATLLVESGVCDGLLAASDIPYARMVKPILRYSSRRAGVSRIAGLTMMALKDRSLFFADTTLIPDPSAEELTEIAMRVTRVVRRLALTPRVAFVSYANFSPRTDHEISKLRRAYKLFRQLQPDVEAFPDVQADVALNPDRFRAIFKRKLPEDPANILIFPNLHSATSAFRLARELGRGSAIGPMLLGLRRPANVLPRGSSEDEIINMMAITAYNAARRRKEIIEGRSTRTWRPVGDPRANQEDEVEPLR